MSFRLNGFREWATLGIILLGSAFFMWGTMIHPYSKDWQLSEPSTGTIETLMSNSNVFGPAQINAIVVTESGRKTIIAVPVDADIRSGSQVRLDVMVNADNPKQKQYRYAGPAED